MGGRNRGRPGRGWCESPIGPSGSGKSTLTGIGFIGGLLLAALMLFLLSWVLLRLTRPLLVATGAVMAILVGLAATVDALQVEPLGILRAE